MNFFKIFALVILLTGLCSCSEKKRAVVCAYTLDQLLQSDTPHVQVVYKNDTMTVVEDVVKDKRGSKGQYAFDKKGYWRYYRFMHNDSVYRFSESYEPGKDVIAIEGKPILQYDLRKKNADTVIFTFSLFALNKKYEGITIISNRGDTITPQYLFKNERYTNVKCFSFRLAVADQIRQLRFFTDISVLNLCNNHLNKYKDTIDFHDIVFP